MHEYGVYVVIPVSHATGGKHVGGFPIAHMNGQEVRWRFVATEINGNMREDNHQGTPPRMLVRTILRRAGSSPDSDGEHRRMIRTWDVRKAFVNADIGDTIYVHPGHELCDRGYCWWCEKAMHGTRKASQRWGEALRTVVDDDGWESFVGWPNVYYLPPTIEYAPEDDDSMSVCHCADFLAEGHEEQLCRLDACLNEQLEVTSGPMLGPGRPGQTRYLKRISGCIERCQMVVKQVYSMSQTTTH